VLIRRSHHPAHHRLHQPLVVRLRAQESGFKLITEGRELFTLATMRRGQAAAMGGGESGEMLIFL